MKKSRLSEELRLFFSNEKNLDHVLINYFSEVASMTKMQRNKGGSLDIRRQPAKTVWNLLMSLPVEKRKYFSQFLKDEESQK